MYKENKRWNKNEQELQTKYNRFRIKEVARLAEKLQMDPQLEVRRKERICKWCYYHVQGALQTFTDTQCAKCQKIMRFSTSNIDRLCKECAEETNSCKHCGGEMD